MDAETARNLLEEELATARALTDRQRLVLGEDRPPGTDEPSSSGHQADAATDTYDREQELTILRLAEERVVDVTAALARLRSGAYGRCETCHEAIGDERLEAEPAARFCESHELDWELHRLLAAEIPNLADTPSVSEPGWRELDAMPDDEDADEPEDLVAEELAIHVEAEDQWLGSPTLAEEDDVEPSAQDLAEDEGWLAGVTEALDDDERLGR